MSDGHLPTGQRPTTTYYAGTRWTDRALTYAQEGGIADDAADLTLTYLDGGSCAATDALVNGVPVPNRVRVMRDGLSVFLGLPDGVIIHVVLDDEERVTTAPEEARPVGPRQHRPAARQGPKDFAQLTAWLQDAGYEVEVAQSGHVAVRRPDGSLVQHMARTPSDWRSLKNTVARLRVSTGLDLRR